MHVLKNLTESINNFCDYAFGRLLGVILLLASILIGIDIFMDVSTYMNPYGRPDYFFRNLMGVIAFLMLGVGHFIVAGALTALWLWFGCTKSWMLIKNPIFFSKLKNGKVMKYVTLLLFLGFCIMLLTFPDFLDDDQATWLGTTLLLLLITLSFTRGAVLSAIVIYTLSILVIADIYQNNKSVASFSTYNWKMVTVSHHNYNPVPMFGSFNIPTLEVRLPIRIPTPRFMMRGAKGNSGRGIGGAGFGMVSANALHLARSSFSLLGKAGRGLVRIKPLSVPLKFVRIKVSGAKAKIKTFGKNAQKSIKSGWSSAKVTVNSVRAKPKVKYKPFQKGKEGHIFRDKPGHFKSDTIMNRKLIRETAIKKNHLGKDNRGNNWYARTIKNDSRGTQVWVETRNGSIRNAGINQKSGTFNPETGLKRNLNN